MFDMKDKNGEDIEIGDLRFLHTYRDDNLYNQMVIITQIEGYRWYSDKMIHYFWISNPAQMCKLESDRFIPRSELISRQEKIDQ